MGVIDTLSGAEWELHGPDDVLCDQDGETVMPAPEILEPLGLNTSIYQHELDYMQQYAASMRFFFPDGEITRADVINYLNDHVGLRFTAIADEIERLGWHNV